MTCEPPVNNLFQSHPSHPLTSSVSLLPPPPPPQFAPLTSERAKLDVTMVLNLFSRESNVRKHSKPGAVPMLSEREKHVVAVVK